MLSVVEIELQALITEREGMVANNQYRCLRGETVAYPDEAFLELAEQIRALKPIEPPANGEQQLKSEIAALSAMFRCPIPVDGCHTALVGLVSKLRQLSAV